MKKIALILFATVLMVTVSCKDKEVVATETTRDTTEVVVDSVDVDTVVTETELETTKTVSEEKIK